MKKIVFFGNCQADALCHIYRVGLCDPQQEEVHYVPAYLDLTEAQIHHMKTSDRFVIQILDHPTHEELLAGIDTARCVYVPHVTGAFLWPHSGVPHARFSIGKHSRAAIFPNELGDRYLNKKIAESAPADETIAAYAALDLDDLYDLDTRCEFFLDRQEMRDERAGIAAASFIRKHFRRTRLFITPNHMAPAMFRYLASEVYRRLGVNLTALGRLLDSLHRSPFSPFELPLHPRVCDHYRLEFAGRNTRYEMLTGERVTFDEYVRLYVTLDINEDLMRGLEPPTFSNSASRQEHVSVLRQGLARSQGSARASVALSRLLLDDGDVAAGVEAMVAAATSDPANPHIVVPLAQRLIKEGREEAALEWLTDLCALVDAPASVIEVLGHIARNRRDHVAARQYFHRVLEKDPDNINVRILLAKLYASSEGASALRILSDGFAFRHRPAGLYSETARLQLAQGDALAALTMARRGIALFPDDIHLKDLIHTLDGDRIENETVPVLENVH